jgi:tetratricopeptide (TPR) repeat protein
MLLNRKRVKFWQKIVFGFMAALMASFLIFGYSGIASGCSHSSGLNSGNSTLDSQLKAALKQLAKDPQNATALKSAAQAYSAAGAVSTGAVPTSQQTTDLTKAIAYYERYVKLPDAKLGSTAAGYRVQALQAEAVIYSELIDYKSAVTAYQRALKITPDDSQLYLDIANNEIYAGDKAAAIKAYKKFLAIDPKSQFAGKVKTALTALESSSSPSPSPSAS